MPTSTITVYGRPGVPDPGGNPPNGGDPELKLRCVNHRLDDGRVIQIPILWRFDKRSLQLKEILDFPSYRNTKPGEELMVEYEIFPKTQPTKIPEGEYSEDVQGNDDLQEESGMFFGALITRVIFGNAVTDNDDEAKEMPATDSCE
jgi:hypothetical protein